MSHELHASITAKLSDSAREQAAEVQKISAAWASFLDTLPGEMQVKPVMTIGSRASDPARLPKLIHSGEITGRRRGRPRKVQPAA